MSGFINKANETLLAGGASAVYKPINEVVDVVHQLGVACKVAQVVPIGVAKG